MALRRILNTRHYKLITPIDTPGIYHNSDLGLISLSSDGSNWLTIADKNLGATSTDISSTDSYGNIFERGNNYGFPSSGSIGSTSPNQVNAGNYGPNNYYSSSTYIYRSSSPYRWDSSNNDNLRGGITGTNDAMQGPCASGYHIPLSSEWSSIITIWTTLGGGSSDINGFVAALKLPLPGYRGGDTSSVPVYSSGNVGCYWCSDASSADRKNFLELSSPDIRVTQRRPIIGQSIRPFANIAVQPDDTWTVLYQ